MRALRPVRRPLVLVSLGLSLGGFGSCTSSLPEVPGPGTGGAGGGVVTGVGGGGGAVTGFGGSIITGAGGGGGAGGGTVIPCTPITSVQRRIWRLSAAQYSNAVRDLLGLTAGPALNSTGGTAEYAFFSDDAAAIDATLQFGIYEATQAVITQITPRLTQIAACTTGEQPMACAQRFAQTFGERAFRRPLDAGEVTELLKAYTEGAKQDFNTGISLMIQALLQAPSFLYRTELGAPGTAAGATTTLTPHEVASQLSFLFLDSTPDQALLTAADNGSLANTTGISQQVDRLLALDTVKRNLTRIVLDWFNVRQLFSKTKADTFFTMLPAADRVQATIQNDLYTSAQRFVDDVLWSGTGKVTDLITSQKVFVNQRLATLYGLSHSGAAADFSAATDTQRSGMLTQPAVLWAMSDPQITSIVKRGRFVHDDVVCQDPAPSPGNLLDDPEIMAKLAMLPTEIDKSQYRMMTPQCRVCHNLIDPFALVLESFGPAGQFRTTADGKPVDPTGVFASSTAPLPEGSVTGPVAFAQVVNGSRLLNACAVQKMSSYVLGRMIRLATTCEVEQVHDAFEQTDGSIRSLLRLVATADFIRKRTGGAQ